MKNNIFKISQIAWIPAVGLMLLSSACQITTEEELDGPTQVESKAGVGPTNVLARVDDVGKDGKEIFDVTEVQPVPPGGLEGWNGYLSSNLTYPNQARQMGIEGTVIVVFLVNSDGSISNPEILRGIGGGCDEAAIKVVENSPNWSPATQKGKAVNCRMRLPVRFKLG